MGGRHDVRKLIMLLFPPPSDGWDDEKEEEEEVWELWMMGNGVIHIHSTLVYTV